MLLIRNSRTAKDSFSEEQHNQFLRSCEVYIEKLRKNNKMISAQPLVREGAMISKQDGVFAEGPYALGDEVIVGYYHILANDISEAIAIAKENPEFAYTDTARVEVRPIKMKEETTSYTYPSK